MTEAQKLFRDNSDCYADTWSFDEAGKPIEGDVVMAMTEDKFTDIINNLLSERQTPTEANKDPETKALHIADVSNRRELFKALDDFAIRNFEFTIPDCIIDAYFKSLK